MSSQETRKESSLAPAKSPTSGFRRALASAAAGILLVLGLVVGMAVAADPYGADYADTTATPAAMDAGTTVSVPLSIKNTSSSTWAAGGKVGIDYRWKNSRGATVLIGGAVGARTYPTTAVAPDTTWTVNAPLRAAADGGAYTLIWDMVWTGHGWFSSKGVPPSTHSVVVTGPYGVRYDSVETPTSAYCFNTVPATVTVTNVGSNTWAAGGAIGMSYRWRNSRERLVSAGYPGIAPVKPTTDVGPGEQYVFTLSLSAPSKPGIHKLIWDMAGRGVGWFSTHNQPVSVNAIAVAADYHAAFLAHSTPVRMYGAKTYAVKLRIKNTSAMRWPRGRGVAVGYRWRNRATGRPAGLRFRRTYFQTVVEPGETVTMFAKVTAPPDTGSYTLSWDLVHSGVAWFSGRGVPVEQATVKVKSRTVRIFVSLARFRLYLYMGDSVVKSYPIAHGKPSTPTPSATWKVLEKSYRSMTAPMSARHMRLYRSSGGGWQRTGFGIHGTPWPWTIGSMASHGCIRMYNKDAIDLYPRVPIGTKVVTSW